MRQSVTEVQNNILNGFAKTLRSRKSEPTLLEKLVAKKAKAVKSKTETVYGGGVVTSLSSEKMQEIADKNLAAIEAADDKTAPKRMVMGIAKAKVIAESAYSKTQKGLKGSDLEVGETITINGKTFRKVK